MISSTHCVLKRVVFPPPPPTHLNNSTIYKKKKIIYTLTITPPSLFSILQWAGGRTANRADFLIKVLFPPPHQHQYPCNPLYTFCTDPCFNSCLRPAKETKALPHNTNRRKSLQLLFITFTDRTYRPYGSSLKLEYTFLNNRKTDTANII